MPHPRDYPFVTGNYLNFGTKFGQAQGIKLDTLAKLPTLKAAEAAQGTLLNLIAIVCEDSNPTLLIFFNDWVAVWAAANLNYKQLLGDINNLESAFQKLSNELTVLKENKIALGVGKKLLEGKQPRTHP